MRHIPGEGPLGARIMLVGEMPSENDILWGRVFSNDTFLFNNDPRFPAGQLSKLGITKEACYRTNVLKYRPPGGKLSAWWTEKKGNAKRDKLTIVRDSMYFNATVAGCLDEFYAEVAAVRPEVIVAFGDMPLWALTGELGVSKWRGSELVHEASGTPVVPTLHPSAVYARWEERVIVAHDLRKRVVEKLDAPTARKEPDWQLRWDFSYHTASVALLELYDKLRHGPLWLAVDVETKHARIACVGIAWSATESLCIPLMHVSGARWWEDAEEEDALCELLRSILVHPHARLVGQNFNYDRQYFESDPCFRINLPCHFDTQIAQHVMWPGTPKTLDRLASIYCFWYRYWKDEGSQPTCEADEQDWFLYNCFDTVRTWEVARAQMLKLDMGG